MPLGGAGPSSYHAPMPDPQAATNLATSKEVLTVTALNREARKLLESGFGVVLVEGEISNIARPGSGHWYFSLKDSGAQVQCAMFRQRNRLLAFSPADGEQVLVRARVSLYEPRGNYQLIVDFMEPAGEGALRQAFEKLKRKLDAEGLFDAARKRSLPTLPRRVGVITSPSGAAVRDVLKVLARRFPSLPVIIYPVPVQGDGAAEKIAGMLAKAGSRAECDVLVLTRGGGSLEDLWAFNEEVVARAIAASPVPVVSAVGHEVDVSIADLVADLRAPTPSAAAELIVPDRSEWRRRFAGLARRLDATVLRKLETSRERSRLLRHRLRRSHPARIIQQHSQSSDELAQRMRLAMLRLLQSRQGRLNEQRAHLLRVSPSQRINALASVNSTLAHRLSSAMRGRLEALRSRLAVSGATLDAISPLATLGRGYAILRRVDDGRIIRRAHDAKPDDVLEASLGEGRLTTRVVKIIED